MKRLILVAKKYEPELRAAVAAAATGLVGGLARAASADVYNYIKSHLSSKGVPHDDRHADPSTLPAGHVYYHHG
jgi:hypothetical protein